MSAQTQLFPKEKAPRRRPRKLMHVYDAGDATECGSTIMAAICFAIALMKPIFFGAQKGG